MSLFIFYRNVAWSNGTDSHDSGIGHSPPFEGGLGGGSVSGNGSNGIGAHSTGNNSSAPFKNSFLNHASSTNGHDSSNNTLTSGIWGELNKVLGGLDLNGGTGNNGTSSVNNHHNEINKQFLNIGSRSSLDLGTLGRPTTLTPPQEVTSSATSTLSSSNMLQNNTANGIGRQMSLPTDHNTTLPGNNKTFGNLFIFILTYTYLHTYLIVNLSFWCWILTCFRFWRSSANIE